MGGVNWLNEQDTTKIPTSWCLELVFFGTTYYKKALVESCKKFVSLQSLFYAKS